MDTNHPITPIKTSVPPTSQPTSGKGSNKIPIATSANDLRASPNFSYLIKNINTDCDLKVLLILHLRAICPYLALFYIHQ